MLTNRDDRWSPVLWTTIATSELPPEHGVGSGVRRGATSIEER